VCLVRIHIRDSILYILSYVMVKCNYNDMGRHSSCWGGNILQVEFVEACCSIVG
jgi:hypothetical protein